MTLWSKLLHLWIFSRATINTCSLGDKGAAGVYPENCCCSSFLSTDDVITWTVEMNPNSAIRIKFTSAIASKYRSPMKIDSARLKRTDLIESVWFVSFILSKVFLQMVSRTCWQLSGHSHVQWNESSGFKYWCTAEPGKDLKNEKLWQTLLNKILTSPCRPTWLGSCTFGRQLRSRGFDTWNESVVNY